MKEDTAITPSSAAIADSFLTLIERLNRAEETGNAETYQCALQQLMAQYPIQLSYYLLTPRDNSRLASDTVNALQQFIRKYQMSDQTFSDYDAMWIGIATDSGVTPGSDTC